MSTEPATGSINAGVPGTRRPKARPAAGFTLIELLITIAIASVLLAVAIPSFANLSRDNKMRSAVGDLTLDFAYARSEAIKRITPVVLCKSSNGSSCGSAGNWADGWIIFADSNRNNSLDTSPSPGEELLASRVQKSSELRVSTAKFTNFISFLPDGTVNSSGRFEVTDLRGSGALKAICVSTLGRVRLESTAGC